MEAVKSAVVARVEEMESKSGSWSLRKKMVIAGSFIILLIVGLATGLGIGLRGSQGGNSTDDDSPSVGGGHDNGTDHGNGNSTNDDPKLWQPKVGEAWQIVLVQPIKPASDNIFSPNVTVWDLDMYDNDVETFRARQAGGGKVICYFSAGSYENFRTDKDEFKKEDLGKTLDGWPEERWLDVRSPNVRRIMKDRIALAASKGCDAIDPDNVDGFQNDNGVKLTKKDSVDFVRFLAETAASYNMSTGLKNAADMIPDVLDVVQFSVNEQCAEYSECDTFAPFIRAGKPVFHIEYPKGVEKGQSTSVVDVICSRKGKAKGSEGFSTVIKKLKLDGFVEYCEDRKVFNTAVLTS